MTFRAVPLALGGELCFKVRMRGIHVAAVLCLAAQLGAQQPADSAVQRDSAASARPSMAVAEIESAPRWVGARFSDLLTAHRAGLFVSPAGGALGSVALFRIRGAQTIFDNRMPLVILDGMRLDAAADGLGGPARLEDLNPEEIASVDVIPGAAGSAVYGPGAANGVIVVKTREGQRGSSRWEVYSEAGMRRPYRDWPMRWGGRDADNESGAFRTGACSLAASAGGSCVQDSIFSYNPYGYAGLLRTAVTRQYGVAVSGGLPELDYFVSGELDGDGGLLALSSSEVERLTDLGQPPRTATRYPEHQNGAHLRANLRLHPLSGLAVSLRGARIASDLRRPLAANPNLQFDPFQGDWLQPENTEGLDRWLGTADVEWRPVKALIIRGAIGRDRTDISTTALQRWGEGPRPPGYLYLPMGSVRLGTTKIDTRTTAVSAAYEFRSSPAVALQTSVGYERARFRRDSTLRLGGLDSGETWIDSAGLFSSFWGARWGSDWGLYVQQQVDFNGRLALSAGLRRDDFQYFPDAVWHPSLAVSWLLGSTRMRAGYGSAGRRPNAREQERTKELTAGLERLLFADRVHLGVTLYDMRSNVLVGFPSGYPPPYPPHVPRARISNQGIEITVSGQVVQRPEAALAVTLIAWGNRNRVVEMDNGLWVLGYAGGFVRGYPAGGFWSRRVLGFADANGDGIIVPSEVTAGARPEWGGSAYPTQGAALTGDLTLRGGVRLGATFDYQAGHTAFNRAQWSACADLQCRAAVDPATPLAQQAEAVAASSVPAGFFEDADFLKLREVWVSAGAPRGLAAALRARSATLALVGRSLRTWTRYSGIDPEPLMDEYGTNGLIMPRLPEWSLRLRLTY
jgi:outer membrane receptor protein involved in Fe transport